MRDNHYISAIIRISVRLRCLLLVRETQSCGKPQRKQFIAMKFKDYYQILGIEDSASQDEIKRAYRKKARQYHPDVSSEADAEEKFKSINEAYEVLKDEKRRAEFDQLKKHGFRGGDDFRRPDGWQGDWNFDTGNFGQSGDFRGGDFSVFFESIFGKTGGFGGRGFDNQANHGRHGTNRGRHSRGDDIRLGVRVSLENAFRGGKTKITVPEAPGYPAKSLQVNIPAGVTDGQQLRLRGQGRPGAINGDLLLTISHKPHEIFQMDGANVLLTVPVTPLELIEGATLKIPTLDGEVSLKIPPDSHGGKRLRVKGRGLPATPAADQIVTVQVSLPDTLDARSVEQLRDLEASWNFDPRAHFASVISKP